MRSEDAFFDHSQHVRLWIDTRAPIDDVARSGHERVATRLKHTRRVVMHTRPWDRAQIHEQHMRVGTVPWKNFRIIQNDEEMVSVGSRGHEQRRTLLQLPPLHDRP